MKRLVFILSLFISVCLHGQGLVSFGTIAASGSSWVDRMATSYISINSHSVFTQTQIDTIKDRLAEVEDVFGPLGLNKTTCNFFMYFQNSNTSTNLATRTNIKTGATLRWDYGAVAYNQNDLPAQTCNGHISVTSTDGFEGWTTFNISQNTFINPLPNISMTPNVNYYLINKNGYTSDISSWFIPNSILQFYTSNNAFVGATPQINTTLETALNLRGYANNFTLNGTTIFRIGMTVYNYQLCKLPTAQVDAFLAAMDAWYVGANLMTQNCTITIDGATMGIPTGEVNNVNILSLLAKATAQSKLWSFVIRT